MILRLASLKIRSNTHRLIEQVQKNTSQLMTQRTIIRKREKYNNTFCLNTRNLQSPSVIANSFHLQHNSKFVQKSEHYQNHTNSLSSNFINSSNSINSYIFKNRSNLSNSINTIIPQGQVNVTIRNRPRHNTFEQTIQNRKRSQNKPKSTSLQTTTHNL